MPGATWWRIVVNEHLEEGYIDEILGHLFAASQKELGVSRIYMIATVQQESLSSARIRGLYHFQDNINPVVQDGDL
jgi:hypothetical protein